MDTADKYATYDAICALAYKELFCYARDHDGNINLKSFNPKDDDCKFLFAVARNLQGIYNFNITLEVKKIQIIFNKKYRNIKTQKEMDEGIDIHTLVNHIFIHCEKPKDILPEILNEYYKGMC